MRIVNIVISITNNFGLKFHIILLHCINVVNVFYTNKNPYILKQLLLGREMKHSLYNKNLSSKTLIN